MIVFREEFKSIAQFISAMDARPVNQVWKNHVLASEQKGGRRWSGTDSYTEANNLLKFGDKDSAAKLSKHTKALMVKGSGMKKRPTVKPDVTGFYPLVGAVLSGDPMNMLMMNSKMRKHRRVVNILWNVSAPADISREQIIEQGARVLSLIEQLERQGYSVNLSAFLASMNGVRQKKECMMCVVRIKDAAQRMCILKCAYPMVNPSFLRRHMLRYMERHPQVTQKGFVTGYGTPVTEKYYQDEYKEITKGMKYDLVVDVYTPADKIKF